MSFPSTQDRECVQTILNNKVSDLKLFPKLPSKILPKIEVSNIDGAIPSNQVINVLLEKNPELRTKLETNKGVFELVFSKNDLYSNTQTAIIRCSSDIRSSILQKGYLVIDCDRCPCKDHFFIFQCHHCCSFGHSYSRCPRKTNDNLRCLFCAAIGLHESDKCPSRHNINGHACVNCMASHEHEIKVDAISYAANSQNCPIYIREIHKLAQRTEYGNNYVHI